MDDYPFRNEPPDSAPDGHGYFIRECTSFGWWRAHQAGHELENFGNADTWPARATHAGYRVDSKSEPGAIACFPVGVDGAGPYGHIAYVASVHGDQVEVEDYNWFDTHSYYRHTVPASGLLFIHLPRVGEGEAPMTDQAKVALVMLGYAAYLGREGDYGKEIVPLAQTIIDEPGNPENNVHTVIGRIADSDEAKNLRAQLARVLNAPQGGTLP